MLFRRKNRLVRSMAVAAIVALNPGCLLCNTAYGADSAGSEAMAPVVRAESNKPSEAAPDQDARSSAGGNAEAAAPPQTTQQDSALSKAPAQPVAGGASSAAQTGTDKDKVSQPSTEQTSATGSENGSAAVSQNGTASAGQKDGSAAAQNGTASAGQKDGAAASQNGDTKSATGSAAPTASANSPPGSERETADGTLLKGLVEQTNKRSPLLYGSVQSLPKGTAVDLTIMGNINSEVSQKGDEVYLKVAHDVGGSSGVGVPGGWYVHGYVTDVASQRRLGRDGYVEVQFDRLISPNGEYELPFEAKVSTKDKLIKTVAKELAIDSKYVSIGAMGGAIMSVQLTGLPVAIASHGYSVAIGATVGGTLGLFGALKRKGNIASLIPGDEMKLVTAEPISLPGFDAKLLPSAEVHQQLADVDLVISKAHFGKDPGGDRRTSLLSVDLIMNNNTKREFAFSDLAVISDHNQRYFPSIYGGLKALRTRVKPNSQQEETVTFTVNGPKHKYWLVLLDRTKAKELSRVPIN